MDDGVGLWRYSAAPPRIFGIDAHSLVGMFVWFLKMDSMLTFSLGVGLVMFFGWLSWIGYSPRVALLAMRTALVGSRAPALSAMAMRDRMTMTSPYAIPRCMFDKV